MPVELLPMQSVATTFDRMKNTFVENVGFSRRKSVSPSFSAEASSSALRSSRTRPKFRRFFGTPKMGGWPRKRCCKNASIGIHARTSRLSDVEVSFQIRFFWTTTFQVTAPRHCKLYRHVYRNITPDSNLHFWLGQVAGNHQHRKDQLQQQPLIFKLI